MTPITVTITLDVADAQHLAALDALMAVLRQGGVAMPDAPSLPPAPPEPSHDTDPAPAPVREPMPELPPEFRPWTDEDKREACRMQDAGEPMPAIAEALGRAGRQVRSYLWNVRHGSMSVPHGGSAVDYDALLARCLAGERPTAVVSECGGDARKLAGMLSVARRRMAKSRIPSETVAIEPQGRDVPAEAPAEAAGVAGVGEPRADAVPDEPAEAEEAAEQAEAEAPSDAELPESVAAGESPAHRDDDEDDVAAPPWTQAEDARLLRAAMGSSDLDDIADTLDRSTEDVEGRLDALCPEPRNRTTIGAALRGLTRQTAPDWLTLCGRVEKRGEDVSAVAEEAGVSAAALRDHLGRREAGRAAEAARSALWTPENDLALAQAICGGPGGADRAAAALGIAREQVLARWSELLPIKGYQEQTRLLKRLREKAGPVPAH